MDKLLFKLINKEQFSLKINTDLPNFGVIKEIFEFNKMIFQNWTKEKDHIAPDFVLAFSDSCCFQDVYLLAYFLKDYGLKYIYPSRRKTSVISVGTYIFSVINQANYSFAEPLPIDEFLKIDPKIECDIAINNFFKIFNHEQFYIEDEEDIDDVDDFDYSEYAKIDPSENDYERDNFDALTDGQYGDYDDWKDLGGNMDKLQDDLGY